MPTPYERPDRAPTAPAGDQRAVRTLHRPVEGRIIGGVCAGLALHLGLKVRLVRLVFVLLALPGAGLVAYLFLWALTPQSVQGVIEGSSGRVPVDPARPEGPGRSVTDAAAAVGGASDDQQRSATRVLLVGGVLLLAGLVVVAQNAGLDLRLGFLVPLLVVAVGAVIAWSQLDDAQRGRWLGWVVGHRQVQRSPARLRQSPRPHRAGHPHHPGSFARRHLGHRAGRARGPRRRRADRGAVGAAAVERPAPRAGRAAPAPPSAPTSPPTCTTRCSRPWPSSSASPTTPPRSPGSPAPRSASCAPGCTPGRRAPQPTLAAAVTEVAHEVEDLHGVADRPRRHRRPAATSRTVTALAQADARGAAQRGAARPAAGHGLRRDRARPGVEAFVRDRGAGFDLDDRARPTGSGCGSRSSAGWSGTAARPACGGCERRTEVRACRLPRASTQERHRAPDPDRRLPCSP